jgi:glycosyltransferase involved in cell wall biosynthesis
VDAGIVAPPHDHEAFLAVAERLRVDTKLRAAASANARRYAEHTFDIESIADRFEAVARRSAAGDRVQMPDVAHCRPAPAR